MRNVVRATALVALLIGMLPAAGVIAVEPPGMEVSEAVHHDVSMPLSGAAPSSPTAHQFTKNINRFAMAAPPMPSTPAILAPM